MNEIKLQDFFDTEYVDFSTYDNVRKICNYVDGQKNVTRKILHTLSEKNINSFTKVSNLGPKIQDYTQYLHGALDGAIVNMTADYIGSGNNVPLLEGDGNFGSAFIPAPAASRYIFARQNDIIKSLFPKDDSVLLEEQWFEGDKIEPKYYVPTLPMMLVNGNEGMSIGYAQKILPRDPKQVARWVTQKASGKRLTARMDPYWKGMTCSVEQGDNPAQWLIKGSIERKTKNQFIITSIPVGYSLKQYQNVLDKLVDDKVIRNYDDLSDDDVFRFDVSCDKDFSSHDDEWILSKLKLIKTVTENYTCIDRENRIIQFNSANEILEAWWKVRLEFNQKRKDYVIDQLLQEAKEMDLKMIFIQGVIEGKIELRGNKEDVITKQCKDYFEEIEPHVKRFMNLPMKVLTQEEIDRLKNKIKENEKEITLWEAKTLEQISLDDVKNVEASL